MSCFMNLFYFFIFVKFVLFDFFYFVKFVYLFFTIKISDKFYKGFIAEKSQKILKGICGEGFYILFYKTI